MRGVLLGVALSVISSPLVAQTTRCTTVGNQTTCRQAPASGVDWGSIQPPADVGGQFMRSFEASRRLADERRAQSESNKAQTEFDRAEVDRQQAETQARQAEYARSDTANKLRESVGIKIRDGDCDGAIREALTAGAIELAQAAKGFCIKR